VIVLALLVGWSSMFGSPASNSADMVSQHRAGRCVLAIDGRDVRDFDDPDNALRLNVDDIVQIEALSEEPTSVTHVSVDLPIGPSIEVKTIRHQLAQHLIEELHMADISDIGVGWYHIEVRSGSCSVAFWVRVYGRSPLTTLIGIGAALTLIAGIALVALAIVRARSGRSSLWWGVGAGLLVGIALCILAQQYAIFAFTPLALGLFVGGGVAGGAASTAAAGGVASAPSAPTPAPAAPPAPPAAGPPPPPPSPPTAPPTPPAAGPPPPPPPPGAPAPGAPTGPTSPSHALPPPSAHPGVGTDEGTATDPPRRSYARIECDDAIVAATAFELTVGLSPTPVSGVVGPALIRPPSSVGDYELTAHVVADGFELAAGETWRKTMLVSVQQPYPHVVFRLIAPPVADADLPQAINVLFSVDSQTMGLGTRSVRVVATADQLDAVDSSSVPGTVGSLGVPVSEQRPDLTVRILRGNEPGRLLWSFESQHATFDVDGESSIGDDPGAFARTVISNIAEHEGSAALALGLKGIGLTIASRVPPEMWAALTKVTDAVAPRRPTVLLLSAEAYVPWELAAMPVPIDSTTIGFLGAQVTMGRWVLATDRPHAPPPRLVHVDGMVVISGRYEQPGWSRLEHAEAEAAALVELYHAVEVDAITQNVVNCLLGNPSGDVLHFSLHGKYDPGSAKQGLVLIDGEVIDPLVVKGGSLVDGPLVFLNACQVGTGQDTLGDYAGLAESFLFAGASAVVAPLWSIDDGVASALAERFYKRAFAGEPIAEIVRSERAAFGTGDNPNSATLMAFQFFGHPAMHLEKV
jgi:CHAT domain